MFSAVQNSVIKGLFQISTIIGDNSNLRKHIFWIEYLT